MFLFVGNFGGWTRERCLLWVGKDHFCFFPNHILAFTDPTSRWKPNLLYHPEISSITDTGKQEKKWTCYTRILRLLIGKHTWSRKGERPFLEINFVHKIHRPSFHWLQTARKPRLQQGSSVWGPWKGPNVSSSGFTLLQHSGSHGQQLEGTTDSLLAIFHP